MGARPVCEGRADRAPPCPACQELTCLLFFNFFFKKKAQIKNRLDFSFFNHHRLPGTFWVKLQPSEARVDNLTPPPPHLIREGGNAAVLQRFSRWPKSPPSRSWPSSGLSTISRAARQLKHRAVAAAKLYLTWIRAQLRLGPRIHYCNARVGEGVGAGEGEGVMAEPESVSICCGRHSCLLFSMFQLARALYWDFAVWLPQRAKMARLNPILDHWRMQSFKSSTTKTL